MGPVLARSAIGLRSSLGAPSSAWSEVRFLSCPVPCPGSARRLRPPRRNPYVYRTATKLIACLSLLALAFPAMAQASARDVILDCADNGKLDRKHSQRDLRRAQGRLPTDIDEYSDCREVIAGAITAGSDK